MVTTSPDLVANGQLKVFQTQHFALWYGNGNDQSYNFVRTIAAQGRTMQQVLEETGEWFERLWQLNRDVLNAPMPYVASSEKHKINIFLCGTGRPNSDGDKDECGASAGRDMGLSAWAMAKGSNVITHEFGHVVQSFSDGFHGATAGPIWETGAEWTAHVLNPSFSSDSFYLNNLEYGPLFSVSRYAAYPFMHFLFENDRTRSSVLGTWKPQADNAQVDFLEAVVAEGQRTGAYPQGYRSFADDAGWYGARLLTMDFLNQRNMLDSMRAANGKRWQANFYLPMVRSATDSTVYAPPAMRALRQWGTHLIPLTASATSVKVTLTGATAANGAAWRFGIVAVTNNDTPTYSALGKAEGTGSGTVSLSIPAGARLYLAVTATPYQYQRLGWEEIGQPAKGATFAYSIKLTGATARTGAVASCDPEAVPDAWTDNYGLTNNTGAPRPCS